MVFEVLIGPSFLQSVQRQPDATRPQRNQVTLDVDS